MTKQTCRPSLSHGARASYKYTATSPYPHATNNPNNSCCSLLRERSSMGRGKRSVLASLFGLKKHSAGSGGKAAEEEAAGRPPQPRYYQGTRVPAERRRRLRAPLVPWPWHRPEGLRVHRAGASRDIARRRPRWIGVSIICTHVSNCFVVSSYVINLYGVCLCVMTMACMFVDV